MAIHPERRRTTMLAPKAKRILLTATAQIAAAVLGVGAAFAAATASTSQASASHQCTHYTPVYQTADPASQPQLCYEFRWIQSNSYVTQGGATPRNSNMISFNGYSRSWHLQYLVPSSYKYTPGFGDFGSIGSSDGQAATAECYFAGEAALGYCTTIW
jgi:hypothetical protein